MSSSERGSSSNRKSSKSSSSGNSKKSNPALMAKAEADPGFAPIMSNPALMAKAEADPRFAPIIARGWRAMRAKPEGVNLYIWERIRKEVRKREDAGKDGPPPPARKRKRTRVKKTETGNWPPDLNKVVPKEGSESKSSSGASKARKRATQPRNSELPPGWMTRSVRKYGPNNPKTDMVSEHFIRLPNGQEKKTRRGITDAWRIHEELGL